MMLRAFHSFFFIHCSMTKFSRLFAVTRCISFSRSADSFEAVTINNKPIEVVTSVKPLCLTISNNLKWNAHIENVIKKESPGFIS